MSSSQSIIFFFFFNANKMPSSRQIRRWLYLRDANIWPANGLFTIVDCHFGHLSRPTGNHGLGLWTVYYLSVFWRLYARWATNEITHLGWYRDFNLYQLSIDKSGHLYKQCFHNVKSIGPVSADFDRFLYNVQRWAHF